MVLNLFHTWPTAAQTCRVLLQRFCYRDKKGSLYFQVLYQASWGSHKHSVLGVAWCGQAASPLEQSFPSQNDFSSTCGVCSESGWKTHLGCFCIQTKTNTVELYTVKETSWLWRTRAEGFDLFITPSGIDKKVHEKVEKQAHWNHKCLTTGWLGYEDFSRKHGITYLAQGYLHT